jgi:hypothetical protein
MMTLHLKVTEEVFCYLSVVLYMGSICILTLNQYDNELLSEYYRITVRK